MVVYSKKCPNLMIKTPKGYLKFVNGMCDVDEDGLEFIKVHYNEDKLASLGLELPVIEDETVEVLDIVDEKPVEAPKKHSGRPKKADKVVEEDK